MQLSTTPLTNGCRKDDMIQLGSLRSQLLLHFVQINEAYFVYLLFQYMPHTVINWIQIWLIWESQLGWNKFWSFFL